MRRFRIVPLAAAAALVSLLPAPTPAQVVVEDFAEDPTDPSKKGALFEVLGENPERFHHDPSTLNRFPGDKKGSLTVTYDSLDPTGRFFTVFPGGFTEQDDFIFGAVITIRPEGFAADPFAFHPIAFSLFNSGTTGDDRTGDLSDFRADTFDTVEFAYFPNVTAFGGPFSTVVAFGEAIADDAFLNFSFTSSPAGLQAGITYLVEVIHSSAGRTLTARISRVMPAGNAAVVEDGLVIGDLSGVSGFLVDSLGISAYHDGFNEFALSGRSLLATVDYDLLFSGPIEGGSLPEELKGALQRLKRSDGGDE